MQVCDKLCFNLKPDPVVPNKVSFAVDIIFLICARDRERDSILSGEKAFFILALLLSSSPAGASSHYKLSNTMQYNTTHCCDHISHGCHHFETNSCRSIMK